jgi:hypothetical protein
MSAGFVVVYYLLKIVSAERSGECCELCPEKFYENLALLEVSTEHKIHAMNKFNSMILRPSSSKLPYNAHYKGFNNLEKKETPFNMDLSDGQDNTIAKKTFSLSTQKDSALLERIKSEGEKNGVVAFINERDSKVQKKGGSAEKIARKKSGSSKGSENGRKTAKQGIGIKKSGSNKGGSRRRSRKKKGGETANKGGKVKKRGSKGGKGKGGNTKGGALVPPLEMVSPHIQNPIVTLQPSPVLKPQMGMFNGGKCCDICVKDFLPPTEWSGHSNQRDTDTNFIEKNKQSMEHSKRNPGRSIPCCNVCISQFYPPRDFMDVTEFLEIYSKNKEPRNQQCACRVCENKLTGSFQANKMAVVDGLDVDKKTPRNPSNHRNYNQ